MKWKLTPVFKDLAWFSPSHQLLPHPIFNSVDLPACLHTSSALHPQISDILVCVCSTVSALPC